MNTSYLNSVQKNVLSSKPLRAIYLLLMVLFVCLFSNVSNAQTASSTWALTANGNPAIVGNVAGTAIAFGSKLNNPVYSSAGITTASWTKDAKNLRNDEYYEFKVTPNTNALFKITAINFEHSRSSGNWLVQAFYSTDNFATSTPIATAFSSNNSTPFANNNAVNIDVENATLTVRIYGWESDGNNQLRIRNVVISGTTCTKPLVPETATAYLATCSGFTAQWGYSHQATTYYVDVATNSSFAPATIVPAYNNLNVGNFLSLGLTGLNPGTTYYYRVRASNSCVTSSSSTTMNYSTLPFPTDAPVANAATNVQCSYVQLNFSSGANVTGVYLDIARDNTFTDFVSGYNNYNVAYNNGRIPVHNLPAGTLYYRIRGYNGCGVTANSNTISFSTASPIGGNVSPIQSICSGTFPANLTLTGYSTTNTEILKWQKSSEVTFSSPIDITEITPTLSGTTIGNLTTNTYFRALVRNRFDSWCESFSNPVLISITAAPTATATIVDATCANDTNGSITLTSPDNAIEFKNADSDFIDLGSAFTLANRAAFTVEGWVKFNKSDIGNRNSLFGQNDVIEFGFDNNNNILLWTASGGSVTTTLTAAFGNNAWHHIAAVGSGTNLKIYIDGILLVTGGSSTTNYGSVLTYTPKIGSGVIDPTGGGFTGQIKKVGMYSTALSAATITALAVSPTTYTGLETGLLGGYNFSEGAGTTLTRLPAGTNGTFQSTPEWNYTYSWTKAGTPSYTASTRNISALSEGTYNLSITTLGTSCPSITSFIVGGSVTNTWTTVWSQGTPNSTQKLVFKENYPPASNPNVDINGCSCKVNGGVSVTIKSGRTLTITNEVEVVGGGSLIFENNASLVQINNVTNKGDIEYQRSTNSVVLKTDYVYWSSPVLNQYLGDLSAKTANGTFYSFNTDTEDWSQAFDTTKMDIGKGYIVRRPDFISGIPVTTEKYTAYFVGVPNNGTITVPGGFNGAALGTSNLLGNPYPSAIDADKFLAANASVLSGTLYFWTHNTQIGTGTSNLGTGAFAYTSNDYAVYNLTGGVVIEGVTYLKGGTISPSGGSKPSGKIAAGQGFFATSIAAGDVTFTNAMRVAGTSGNNSQFFKTKSPNGKAANTIEKNRVWLNLTNTQGAFKQTLIGYITDATNDYDDRFDGESFDGNEFVDFYSVNQDKNLVIQGRALPFDETDEVQLGFRTTINGAFTINIDQVDGLLTNQAVFIQDKLTNTVTDLKSGNYTFNTEAGTFNDRFVLKYSNKTLGTNNFDSLENKVLVSNKNKQIKINSFAETIDTVVIYDLLGRQIYQKDKVNSNEFSIANLLSSHQVLVVKTLLQNGKTFTDKIIY